MLSMQQRFIQFYHTVLSMDPLFIEMGGTFENSPWHREANVKLHTDMVVSNYLQISSVYSRGWLAGAFACAFHDVGKPESEETLFSESRGEYRRYAGHEMISSRLWENWAVTNWVLLNQTFPEICSEFILQVGWIIQHHLPFSLKDKTKLDRLHSTAAQLFEITTFTDCLLADCLGRISDDHNTKWKGTFDWSVEFLNRTNDWTPHNSDKLCVVLIGASGSGKSSWVSKRLTREIPCTVHSMDALRHDWYGDDYATAYQLSTEDKTFKSRVQQHFMDIVKAGNGDVIIDNTNTSVKSRGFYVQEARKKGYEVHAVLFPASLDQIIARQSIRGDKNVPRDAVVRQYNNLQYPFYGEFDCIFEDSNNLPKLDK